MNEHKSKEQKVILSIYALFGVSLVLSILPSLMAATLSMVLFTLLLIMAYVLRGKCDEQSLQHNHMVFVIRTLWITGFLSLLTLSAASVYIFIFIDPLPFQPCAVSILDHAMDFQQEGGSALFMSLIEPCLSVFLSANMTALFIAGAIAAVPVLIYVSIRFVRGMRCVIKGDKLPDPKRLF